jgi:hypothetical protein
MKFGTLLFTSIHNKKGFFEQATGYFSFRGGGEKPRYFFVYHNLIESSS